MVTMAFFCCCCSAFFNSPSCRKFSHSFAILRSNTNDNDKTSPEQQQQQKRRALELLECLTSPNDPDDPNYDAEKDVRRDELLLANDYYELKLELKDRGLRSNGDKLEMIARLLLHTIDPNMNYNPMQVYASNFIYKFHS